MIPINKVKDIIIKHNDLEKELASGSIDPKLFAKKSKEISITSDVIDSCYDGDTCTTASGEKIRLACIDTPEIRGPRANPEPAKAARDFLNSNVAGKEVAIRRITKDRYERTVAELAKDGINIQKMMVEKGHGKIYEKYSHHWWRFSRL